MPLQVNITDSLLGEGVILPTAGANTATNYDNTIGAPDTTPDPVNFGTVANATKGQVYLSRAVGIWGITQAVPISVTPNGEYEINGSGTFASAPGTISEGQTVRLRAVAPLTDAATTVVTVTIGGLTYNWTIGTPGAPAGDTTPTPLTFPAVTGVALSTYVVSELRTPVGFDTTATITALTNAEYSLNAGPWQSALGAAFPPGTSLRLRVLTGTLGLTARVGSVIIGGSLFAFSVTTGPFNAPDADLDPDFFTFTDVVTADPSTLYVTQGVRISGLGEGVFAPVSVTGTAGTNFGFSKNGGTFGTTATTVKNGDNLRLRLLSPSGWEASSEMAITVGTLTDTWTITTRAFGSDDTFPDNFDSQWEDATDLPPNIDYVLGSFTPTGFDATTQINIVNGEYAINGGGWTDAPGLLDPGQSVNLRVRTAMAGGYKDVMLNIGGRIGVQRVITIPKSDDDTPDPFFFLDVVNATPGQWVESNIIAITGIDVSVTCGYRQQPADPFPDFDVLEYRIDPGTGEWGPWGWDDSTVRNGYRAQLRVMAPSTANTTTTMRWAAGEGTGSPAPWWFVTTAGTAGADTVPNDFFFPAVTGATVSTVYTSAPVLVTGLGTTSTIAITGGTYSKNGGAYVSTPGTVINGDLITVRVTSASTSNAAVREAMLNIGGVVRPFTVTTLNVVLDYMPNGFDFVDISGVTAGTVVDSNVVTITGINTTTTANLSCHPSLSPMYRKNGGTWTALGTTPGTNLEANVPLINNDTLQLRMTVPTTLQSYAVSIGNPAVGGSPSTRVSDRWQTIPANTPDSIPNPFSFTDVTNASLSTVYTSLPITVTGINTSSPISIAGGGGTYSKNGGAFTSAATGTVLVGDTIEVRLTSSAANATAVSTTVTIGGVSDVFSVTTAAVSSGTVDMPTFEDGPWKVTVPLDSSGNLSGASGGLAIEVWPNNSNGNGDLKTYDDTSIYIDRQPDNSIIFVAPTNGARTSGSSYARCELREIKPDASDELDWPLSDGGMMECTCAVLELPTLTSGTTRRAVVGQIHGPNDEMCRLYYYHQSGAVGELRFYDDKAGAGTAGTETSFTLRDGSGNATSIPMGEFFDYKIEADITGCRVSAVYQGVTYTAFSPKSNFWLGTTVMYFKAGVYNAIGYTGQTSPSTPSSRGDGQSRVQFTRIKNPIHPYSLSSTVDTTPNAFSFVDVTGATLSTVYTSNTITVAGINAAAAISITGGTYSINGGAFTSASGTVNASDDIQVRVTSSATASGVVGATLTIGGVSDTYTVTTQATGTTDTTPNAFTFVDVTDATPNAAYDSNPITVQGINAATAISISGTGSYSKNGGAFTGVSGTVNNGDTVVVRATAAAAASTMTSVTLTIGGVSDVFAITTAAAGGVDTVPDDFNFTNQTGLAPSTQIFSNTVTITGINAAAAISVTGGSMKIGTGSFTSTATTINNGQTLQLRNNSDNTSGATKTVTVTVGGVAKSWSITTA